METIKRLDYPEIIAPEESELHYSIHSAALYSPPTALSYLTIEKNADEFTA